MISTGSVKYLTMGLSTGGLKSTVVTTVSGDLHSNIYVRV
jgi:hypothetical protein